MNFRLGGKANKGESLEVYTPKTWGELHVILRELHEIRGDDGDYNDIDTQYITDMSDLFYGTTFKWFNGDISQWNTSNVTKMERMFCECEHFNCDISQWDTSKVEDMSNMFWGASSFNQDIGRWDVSHVKNMHGMFTYASTFNQDISKWDVSNVIGMSRMFNFANQFNQDISCWDTSNVNSTTMMFCEASSFNQDLSNWDMSHNIMSDYMFDDATSLSIMPKFKLPDANDMCEKMFRGTKISKWERFKFYFRISIRHLFWPFI